MVRQQHQLESQQLQEYFQTTFIELRTLATGTRTT